MKLRYVILYVADVAAGVDFYEKAFGLTRRMLHEGGDYGELETGGTRLAFSSKALMRQLGKTPGEVDPQRPVFEVAFETDDVAAGVARAVAAGAELATEPTQQPWGQTIAYVRDLNGYLVEICTPVGA